MRILGAIGLALATLTILGLGLLIGRAVSWDSLLQADRYVHPQLGSAISGGVATRQHIWLYGQSGRAVRYDRRTGERDVVGHNVRDLLADGPHLWALSANAETGQFALHDLRNPNSPPHQGRFSETLLRAFKTPNGVGVLTVQSIYTLTGERWERIPLSTPVDSHTSHVAAGGPGTIFLGTDLGEFGGSLHRLATTSGQVWTYGVTGQDPCEADFDPECDPIVGLLPDANHPGCVVAASGQFHMGMTHGRIFRVCENSMTVTYVTPNRTP